MSESFEERARAFWTEERESKITGGKSWLLRPSEAPRLLRAIGLLNRDASMPADAVRKFSQINHMLALVAPQLEDLAQRHKVVRILDACCGTSYLALLCAWFLSEKLGKTCEIVGIDSNEKVVQTSRDRANQLGYGAFAKFAVGRVTPEAWGEIYAKLFPASEGTSDGSEGAAPRPHAVLALHACDTATDYAAATGIALKADVIALAPCCHAELARKWKDVGEGAHPFSPIFKTPNLRRETAAQVTDAMRLLLLRSKGYEVTATEFVPSEHTPKNRLLLCERRGNFLREAETQYRDLKASLAGQGIALEELTGGA